MSWRHVCTVRVDGIPKGQPRARSSSFRKGVYTPSSADEWKARIVRAFENHMPDAPYDVPIRADITFFMKRPKTWSKRIRELYGGRSKDVPDGPVFHVGKPDRDNLEKAALDALTQAGFFWDDNIVCVGEVSKWIHAAGDFPHANIRVWRWAPPNKEER